MVCAGTVPAGTSGKKFDNALSKLLSIYLDDLHSGLVNNSWRHEKETDAELIENFMNFGASNTMMIASTIKFGNARAQAYEGDIPMYEEVGDTAFYNTDKGIEPDICLTARESFYDREGLAEYLHSIK